MIPTKSALDAYINVEFNRRKGFLDGRDGFLIRTVPDLFTNSLLSARVTINTTGTNDPQSIPVQNWGSKKSVTEAIKEFLKENEDEIKKRELNDAYDRAMSIL